MGSVEVKAITEVRVVVNRCVVGVLFEYVMLIGDGGEDKVSVASEVKLGGDIDVDRHGATALAFVIDNRVTTIGLDLPPVRLGGGFDVGDGGAVHTYAVWVGVDPGEVLTW